MSEKRRRRAAVVVALDASPADAERIAQTLDGARARATPLALRAALQAARRQAPDVRVVAVVDVSAPTHVALARALGADRVVVAYDPARGAGRLRAVALRSALAVVDHVVVLDEAHVLPAVAAGADPERVSVLDADLGRRVATEPARRAGRDGLKEASASLALDALAASGLLDLAERVGARRGANVVNYHRVLPVDELRTYGRPQMAIASTLFEAQLASFRARFGCVPLEAVGTPRARGKVAITFDDGYEDNHRVALPILSRLEVPASIFVVTNLVGEPQALWWDRVGNALFAYWKGPRTEPIPDVLPRRARALESEPSFVGARAIISDVLTWLNFADEADRALAIAAAEALAPDAPDARTMLSWEEVAELRAAGVHFGGHTRNHVVLDEVPEDVAHDEFFGSQATLEEKLGDVGARFAALPRGVLGPLGEDDLRHAGFQGVMTTIPGVNPSEDPPMLLYRRDGNYLTLRGRHHPAKLRLELSGLLDPLRPREDMDH